MSSHASTGPQSFTTPIESGGEAFSSWPQFLTCDRQPGIVSDDNYQSSKRPRTSETTNSKMPVSIKRSIQTIPFKAQLCLQFRRGGHCNYGDQCHFAHSIGDTRKPPINSNRPHIVREDGRSVGNWDKDHRSAIGIKVCRMFSNGKGCQYGDRCHFLHEGLEKVKDLGLSRKSFAISLVNAESGGDCRSWSDGLGRKTLTDSSFNTNQAYQKPVFWRTRLCNMWETTGYCAYGVNCCFAHGQAELQQLRSHTTQVSRNVSTSKILATRAKDASSKRGIEATYEQKVQGKKFLFKWTDIEKISRIYADWIDDIPPVQSS